MWSAPAGRSFAVRATGCYRSLNNKALTSQRTPKTVAQERNPPNGAAGTMLAICGATANLAGIRHAPDDPPSFQCPAVRPDSGNPAVGGDSDDFCRLARGPDDGPVGQQLPQLLHADADGDRRE